MYLRDFKNQKVLSPIRQNLKIIKNLIELNNKKNKRKY